MNHFCPIRSRWYELRKDYYRCPGCGLRLAWAELGNGRYRDR